MSWQARCLNLFLRLTAKRRLDKMKAGEPGAARRARRRLRRLARWLPRPPAGVVIEPVDMDGVPGEWVRAPGNQSGRAFFYLHGGAYSIGSPALYRDLTWRLAQATGAPVLAIDYRLAPEYPFPAALDDSITAWRWLLRSGQDAEAVLLGGDSAGGGLALATLLRLPAEGLARPLAAVCLSPWTDLTLSGASISTNAAADPYIAPRALKSVARNYHGDTDPHEPLVSPLFGDLAGLPPLLLHAGSTEVLLHDATRLAELARAAGVDVRLTVWPRMPHVFQLFARVLPEGRRAIREIGAFASAHFTAD